MNRQENQELDRTAKTPREATKKNYESDIKKTGNKARIGVRARELSVFGS